jgi:hypothetical protein
MQVGLKGRRRSNGTLELEPVIKESFTFHDLRAKSGSDAGDVQEANDRLAYDDCARPRSYTDANRGGLGRGKKWEPEETERPIQALGSRSAPFNYLSSST